MFRLGRPFGVIIGIDLSFFLLVVGVFLISGLSAEALLGTLVIVMCILLHEVGHALAARAFGLRTESITFNAFGAFARIDGLNSARPFAGLVIALAGPLVTALEVEALVLSGHPLLAEINLALLLFNLVPVYPLDGGRAMYNAFQWVLGPGPTTMLLTFCVSATALTVGVVAFITHGGFWSGCIAAFLGGLGTLRLYLGIDKGSLRD